MAAFSGQPEFVNRLRRAGDAFAPAALADKELVETRVGSAR
jgi:hypothetical protein